MSARIFVTFQFEAWHRWPNAPPDCAYLADRHRHIFHVRVEAPVTHSDRDIEFITFKRKAQDEVESLLATADTSTWSCEMWARSLMDSLPPADRVQVSEDGENGAVISKGVLP